MEKLTILDFALTPVFLLLIYFIAYRIRNKKYLVGHPWRKYYIPALTVKLFAAIILGLIYVYYYGYADSFEFFRQAKVINSSLNDSVIKWINLVLHIPDQYDPKYYKYISDIPSYSIDYSSYLVAVFAAIFGLITFQTFLPTSLLFAFLSFGAVWALFRTFASIYPKYTKQVAICILFIPGVVLWASGILKDTLSLFALGWFTHSVFRFLIQKDLRIINLLVACVSFLLLANIKIYILLAFLPAIGLWVLFSYTGKIKNKLLRPIVKFSSLLLLISISLWLMNEFGDKLGGYSLNKLTSTAESYRSWISYSTERDDGSGYDLGKINPTVTGILRKIPSGVNVTLFRPYLWETKKVIVLFSALESTLFLIVTLTVFLSIGPITVFKIIIKDPNIQFFLVFSLVFAFAVGITTYNFGTLSRYKVPCIPFYILAILLIYHSSKPNKKLLLFL